MNISFIVLFDKLIFTPNKKQGILRYLAGDDVNGNNDEACPKVESSSSNVLMQTGEREQKAQFHCELAQPLNYILGNILKSEMYFLISHF